jgi:succinate dehydrogenase/fumarate reductase flavoprotein subunit
MLGAFTYGKICARHAVEFIAAGRASRIDEDQVDAERERVLRPLSRPEGIQPHLMEYKLRRHVNDYLQPPKNAAHWHGQRRTDGFAMTVGMLKSKAKDWGVPMKSPITKGIDY